MTTVLDWRDSRLTYISTPQAIRQGSEILYPDDASNGLYSHPTHPPPEECLWLGAASIVCGWALSIFLKATFLCFSLGFTAVKRSQWNTPEAALSGVFLMFECSPCKTHLVYINPLQIIRKYIPDAFASFQSNYKEINQRHINTRRWCIF